MTPRTSSATEQDKQGVESDESATLVADSRKGEKRDSLVVDKEYAKESARDSNQVDDVEATESE